VSEENMVSYQPEVPLCLNNANHGPAVSGSAYCDDCNIAAQLAARTPPGPVGTLGQLIRDAKKKGLIEPLPSGKLGSIYQSTP
jgi:hypothetical protein